MTAASVETLDATDATTGDPGPEAPAPLGLGRTALEAAAVAVIAWAWAAWLVRVWRMPLRLPLDSRSDATLISAMVKTIEERGWYLDQPRLGAPFGQQFHDFPHGGETFQLLAMRVLTRITGDWGLAVNLYFLAGFGVLAAVTFAVLRHLRFGPVIAGVAALLYTFLPYHFSHGEMHLWRSTYYSAPLAVLLLVWAVSWRERFLCRPLPDAHGRTSVRGNLRWRRVGLAVAVAVVVAGTETMTTAFTMTLLAAGAVVGAIRWREPQRLAVAGLLVAVLVVTFGVLSLPNLDHMRTEGANEVAARRFVTESEWYGLKLTRLVTPEIGHRWSVLSDLGTRAQDKSQVRSEAGQALGILGTAGFLGVVYLAVAGRRRGADRPDVLPGWHRESLREHAVTNTVLALLVGTIGGFSVLVAVAGITQVRVWNRMVLIIAFFAMVTVATWAERLAGRVRARHRNHRVVLGGLAVAVLAVGLWDGIPPVREPYEEIEARHASDRAFVAEIEAILPDGAAVFQLPVLPFPEEVPPGRMLDYDPLRGYLADSGTLRWSYGAVKGRPEADWQVRLRDHVGPVGALPALLGLGFDGLWIDTWGYTDDGAEIARIDEALGVQPIASPDGRFLFYDLRPFRERLGLGDEELRAETRRVLRVEPPEAGR